MSRRSVSIFTFLWAPLLGLLIQSSASAQSSASDDSAEKAFVTQLEKLASNPAAPTGVAIRDLKTGKEYFVRGDQIFSQAGLSKLHILAALMSESAAGRIDIAAKQTLASPDKLPGGVLHRLGDGTVTMSLRDYATLMVAIDDNTAANILLNRIGSASVRKTIATLGVRDVHFAGLTTSTQKPEDNTASPRGLLQCLAAFYDGPVFDSVTRKQFFDVLGTPAQGSFRAGVPAQIPIASKSGIRGALRNNAAIVSLKNHPYAIVIMVQPPSPSDPTAGNDASRIVTKISALACDYFSRLEPAEPAVASHATARYSRPDQDTAARPPSATADVSR